MFKSTLTLILCGLFLVSVPAFAVEISNKDRQEMQDLKIEQAKLKAKEQLLKLKLALNLKPEQNDSWSAYETYVTKNTGHKMQMAFQLRKQKAETGRLPTSIDLATANINRLESELTTAKERLVVFSKLYDVLDKEQRIKVDKLTLQKVKSIAAKTRKTRKHKKSKKTR